MGECHPMIHVESMKSCISIKARNNHKTLELFMDPNNPTKHLKIIFCDQQLHVVIFGFVGKKFKNSFRFLNMNLCAVNCNLNKRKATLILEACHNPQQIFIAWSSNLTPYTTLIAITNSCKTIFTEDLPIANISLH